MKILITNFHHRNGGGHVTYIINLAKSLAQHHDVTIATPGTSRLFRYASSIPNVTTIDICFTSRIFKLVPEVLRLRRLIKAGNFDVVHVNASADHRHIMLACLGLRRRPKIVWTKHNDHAITSLGHRLRAWLGTDSIIAVSDYVASLLAGTAYKKIPIHVIRHGIDTQYFAPVSVTKKNELRTRLFGSALPEALVLGSTGGTDYDKGWLDLALALSLLEPEQRQRIKVVVAGDPLNAQKQQRLNHFGVQDQFLFPGLLDDVRDTLAACDAGFVLSYREALSFACRESMAVGLPTLVSNVGGLPENILDKIDGWVVPAGDPAAIAVVLNSMLADPESLSSMGKSARRKSETDFSLQCFVDATLSVYQQVTP